MTRVGAALASAMCRLAAQSLPRDIRPRYAAEWRADLAASPGQARGYALSILLHVLALRRELTVAASVTTPLRCRLRLHHEVTVHDNPEDPRFTSHHCTRCGRVRDDWRRPTPSNGYQLGGGGATGLR